jgi:glycosyltransferase involved in cell wall biosynthesis
VSLDRPIELSIVMPCLNEAETLARCIDEARDFLNLHRVRGEIVIGDNDSDDGSLEIARKMGVRSIVITRRGYGAAVRGAISACQGRYVIMADSDLSYDFTNLLPLLQQLRAGSDLVMGSRFRGEIHQGAMPWLNRWIGNPFLTGIGQWLFGISCSDFHCGLRGLTLDSYHQMNLKANGMELASEMVIKAHLCGLRVTEVPVVLRKDGRSRPSSLRPLRDGLRHLALMASLLRWSFRPSRRGLTGS